MAHSVPGCLALAGSSRWTFLPAAAGVAPPRSMCPRAASAINVFRIGIEIAARHPARSFNTKYSRRQYSTVDTTAHCRCVGTAIATRVFSSSFSPPVRLYVRCRISRASCVLCGCLRLWFCFTSNPEWQAPYLGENTVLGNPGGHINGQAS